MDPAKVKDGRGHVDTFVVLSGRPPRSRVTTFATLLVVVAVAVTALAGGMLDPSPAAAAAGGRAQWGVAEEQGFVGRINQLRASRGLPTLAVDPELQAQARAWATVMRDHGEIFHTGNLPAGITSDWQKLGENVGVGGSVDSLFDAFVASPTHFDNLVDPTYRYIGVGVVWDGARMFTTHRFMSLRPPAPEPSPTHSPAPAPAPPDELASVDPPTVAPTAVPPPAPPAPAPATPERIALVAATLAPVLG